MFAKHLVSPASPYRNVPPHSTRQLEGSCSVHINHAAIGNHYALSHWLGDQRDQLLVWIDQGGRGDVTPHGSRSKGVLGSGKVHVQYKVKSLTNATEDNNTLEKRVARAASSNDSSDRTTSLSHARVSDQVLMDLNLYVDKDLNDETYPAVLEIDAEESTNVEKRYHVRLLDPAKTTAGENVVERCNDDMDPGSAQSVVKGHNETG